jgi:hypothetical protein
MDEHIQPQMDIDRYIDRWMESTHDKKYINHMLYNCKYSTYNNK